MANPIPTERSIRRQSRAWSGRVLPACAMGIATLVTAALPSSVRAAADWEIRTLSSKPNLVSGGDAVVEVQLPRYASKRDVVVRLNGVDVSSQMNSGGGDGKLVGLITGMRIGKNQITVGLQRQRASQHSAVLDVVNHPISGQMFGPHQRPWVCETEASGLGIPLGATERCFPRPAARHDGRGSGTPSRSLATSWSWAIPSI